MMIKENRNRIRGIPVVGSSKDIAYALNNDIDEIVIAIPSPIIKY